MITDLNINIYRLKGWGSFQAKIYNFNVDVVIGCSNPLIGTPLSTILGNKTHTSEILKIIYFFKYKIIFKKIWNFCQKPHISLFLLLQPGGINL